MIEIKHKITDKVLYRIDSNSLINAYLSGINLSEANLRGVDLSGADLYGANLSCANLAESNLYGANLSCANLYRTNLYKANLSGTDLSGANLSDAYLYGTIGNGKEIKNIIHIYDVVWTDKQLWIGCQNGSIDDWRNGNVKLSKDERKKWDKYRDALLMLIDAD